MISWEPVETSTEVFAVGSARHAKGKLAVRVRSTGAHAGWKGRLARCLDDVRARYSGREGAYIVSPSQLRRACVLYHRAES